jgi:hypothetical protein
MCHVHLQQDILPHKEQQHPQYLLFSFIACQNLRLLSTLGAETGKRRLKGEAAYKAIVLNMHRVKAVKVSIKHCHHSAMCHCLQIASPKSLEMRMEKLDHNFKRTKIETIQMSNPPN